MNTSSGADVLDAARALRRPVAAAAAGIEAAGALPAWLVEELAAAGVFALFVPAELGGREADPRVAFEVFEELARADASVGWCAVIGASNNALLSLVSPEGAAEMYAGPPTVTCGVLNPKGRARREGDHYVVSGRWSFASGCRHSHWVCGAALVEDEVRLLFAPIGEAVVHENWDVSGLRGTGSHDFELRDVAVPAHRTAVLGSPAWPGGALWRVPTFGLLFPPLAAVALGAARAAVDGLVALAGRKTPYRSTRRLDEREVTQAALAEAEAALGSARAYLLDRLDHVWAGAREGREPELRDRALLRLAVVNAAAVARRVTAAVHQLAGTSAIVRSSPFDRSLRDVYTATQHVALAASGFETVGRVLLGLDPDTPLL